MHKIQNECINYHRFLSILTCGLILCPILVSLIHLSYVMSSRTGGKSA